MPDTHSSERSWKNYFGEKARRHAAYWIIARTAALVDASEDLKRLVVERIGIPADRIKVIYNGVTLRPLLLICTERLQKRFLNILGKF